MPFYRVSVDLKDGRREMVEGVKGLPYQEDGGVLIEHPNCTVWISLENVERWEAVNMHPTPEIEPNKAV